VREEEENRCQVRVARNEGGKKRKRKTAEGKLENKNHEL
jgi:hypothetical protein